jgi:Cu/Ag efflux pump CusA
MELTTLLNWYVNPLLKTVPGIVEVNTFGGETKQYQIKVDLVLRPNRAYTRQKVFRKRTENL